MLCWCSFLALVIKYFFRLCKQATAYKSFKFHLCRKTIQVYHIVFAYDLTRLCREGSQSAQCLLNAFNEFLQFNSTKYHI